MGTDLMSDSVMELAITDVENYTERWLNTKFAPTTKIDLLDGDNSNTIILSKNPVLALREINVEGNTLSPEYVVVYKESGKIVIGARNTDAPEVTNFKSGEDQLNRFKYVHGWVEPDENYQTSSTVALVSADIGTSVSITVADSSVFTALDWVEIEDIDGFREAFKILSITDSTHIVADQIVQPHSSGSLITKLVSPYYIKRFMELEAGLYCVLNAIGSTYTFSASYSIGPFSAVKGVPYTHWREVYERLIRERDMIKGKIGYRPAIFT